MKVFKTLPNKKTTLSDEDKKALSNVLTQLPQVLSFIVANSILTGTTEDRVLPCSGSIEMLSTFENKTNRYLGNDGSESIEEILTRWVGFAPYIPEMKFACAPLMHQILLVISVKSKASWIRIPFKESSMMFISLGIKTVIQNYQSWIIPAKIMK